MFPSISVVNDAVKKLFDATASVYVDNPVTDATTNITKHTLSKLLGTMRCRISYKRVLPVITEDTVDKDTQKVILIYATDSGITIPDGSLIIVTFDDGRTGNFNNSGLPKVYQYTTQVELQKAEVKP